MLCYLGEGLWVEGGRGAENGGLSLVFLSYKFSYKKHM